MGSGRGMCFWISSVPWEKQVILVKMLGYGACQPSKPQQAIPTRHPENGRRPTGTTLRRTGDLGCKQQS